MKGIKVNIKVVSRKNNVIDTITRYLKIGTYKNKRFHGIHYVKYKNKNHQVFDRMGNQKLRSLVIYP